jgi:hypothetical protein
VLLAVAATLLLVVCMRSRAGGGEGVLLLAALWLAGARFRFDPRPRW